MATGTATGTTTCLSGGVDPLRAVEPIDLSSEETATRSSGPLSFSARKKGEKVKASAKR